MAKQQRTWGVFILQVALAIYLVVTGICLFGKGSSISSEEIRALTTVFKDSASVVNIVLAILLIACGIIFFIKAFTSYIFNKSFDLGKVDDVIKYVTLVLWIIITIVSLVNNINDVKSIMILHWLLILAKNAFIIGGILTIKNGK